MTNKSMSAVEFKREYREMLQTILPAMVEKAREGNVAAVGAVLRCGQAIAQILEEDEAMEKVRELLREEKTADATTKDTKGHEKGDEGGELNRQGAENAKGGEFGGGLAAGAPSAHKMGGDDTGAGDEVPPDWRDPSEVAEDLGLTLGEVMADIESGELVALKIPDGYYQIYPDEFNRYKDEKGLRPLVQIGIGRDETEKDWARGPQTRAGTPFLPPDGRAGEGVAGCAAGAP
ncbi:MAG: hypothetical protein HY280_06100 [Nitrospinae bacterium]|nr:hypothetical protein [Nitrospinota bacterium]